MSERLKAIKEKSKLRRQLLAPIVSTYNVFIAHAFELVVLKMARHCVKSGAQVIGGFKIACRVARMLVTNLVRGKFMKMN